MAPLVRVLIWTMVRLSFTIFESSFPFVTGHHILARRQTSGVRSRPSSWNHLSTNRQVIPFSSSAIFNDMIGSELKELIALHSDVGELGGDLKTDTVTIIGATLDLQEKVVRQVCSSSWEWNTTN